MIDMLRSFLPAALWTPVGKAKDKAAKAVASIQAAD
jgi:hypothetical protein